MERFWWNDDERREQQEQLLRNAIRGVYDERETSLESIRGCYETFVAGRRAERDLRGRRRRRRGRRRGRGG